MAILRDARSLGMTRTTPTPRRVRIRRAPVRYAARIAAAAPARSPRMIADHDAVVLGMRFRQPAEIAKLRAAERLHPHPRRQRDLGNIAVLRTGIDRVVKPLIDFMKPLGIAGVSSAPAVPHARPPAAGAPPAVMRSAARPAHSASSSAIASNIPVSRSSEGRATTAPRCARASTRPLAASWRSASRTGVRDTLKRRAMSVSSSAAPGGQRAAHDLVGELQAQLLRARDLVRGRATRGRRAAPRLRLATGRSWRAGRKIVEAHRF